MIGLVLCGPSITLTMVNQKEILNSTQFTPSNLVSQNAGPSLGSSCKSYITSDMSNRHRHNHNFNMQSCDRYKWSWSI